MYDLDRLKSFLKLCGAVLLFLYAANVALTLTTALFPGVLPHQFFGVDFLAENEKRARGAAAQYRDGILGDDDPLVVILGLSSASEGVQLSTLRQQPGDRTRYLGLSGAGRNMREVARYAAPLLESDVRPALVVFALSPFHLMDPPPLGEGFVNNLHQRSTIIELAGFWFYARRKDIKHVIDVGVLDARSALYRWFDVRVDESGADPWRDMERMGLPATTGARQWQANIQRYGLRGYYDAESYNRSETQAAVLIDLVKQFRARRTDVVIVLMPEHSTLRARIPDAAMQALSGPLRQAFGPDMPSIVDLRKAVADSGFNDISHMNSQGRSSFSPLLAELIRENLAKSAAR